MEEELQVPGDVRKRIRNHELSYTAYDGVVIVSIPEELRPSLAKQEAVVIKVAV